MATDATIETGDVVLARFGNVQAYGVVRGARLGRLVVERCDGQPCGPVAGRDVTRVYKNAGAPDPRPPATERLRPTAQMRLDLDAS